MSKISRNTEWISGLYKEACDCYPLANRAEASKLKLAYTQQYRYVDATDENLTEIARHYNAHSSRLNMLQKERQIRLRSHGAELFQTEQLIAHFGAIVTAETLERLRTEKRLNAPERPPGQPAQADEQPDAATIYRSYFANPEDIETVQSVLQSIGWISEMGKWRKAKNRLAILFDVLETKDMISGVLVHHFCPTAATVYKTTASDGTARFPAYDNERQREDRAELLQNF